MLKDQVADPARVRTSKARLAPPLHLMLADTPLPRGFGAALASVDTFFQGLQNSSLPPRSAL
jgi:hypothetical protein